VAFSLIIIGDACNADDVFNSSFAMSGVMEFASSSTFIRRILSFFLATMLKQPWRDLTIKLCLINSNNTCSSRCFISNVKEREFKRFIQAAAKAILMQKEPETSWEKRSKRRLTYTAVLSTG